eukprot:TRINITY_DN50203_c0_g1_i2.p1 TRINITY_DN50203_c0_g1~~TRINITY_DN50203_c0_g1_i2.p1  ORF type:complete len:239 (+),score=26.69 TRINITY_DN50203_c0_g1_i2:28-744(+)
MIVFSFLLTCLLLTRWPVAEGLGDGTMGLCAAIQQWTAAGVPPGFESCPADSEDCIPEESPNTGPVCQQGWSKVDGVWSWCKLKKAEGALERAVDLLINCRQAAGSGATGAGSSMELTVTRPGVPGLPGTTGPLGNPTTAEVTRYKFEPTLEVDRLELTMANQGPYTVDLGRGQVLRHPGQNPPPRWPGASPKAWGDRGPALVPDGRVQFVFGPGDLLVRQYYKSLTAPSEVKFIKPR